MTTITCKVNCVHTLARPGKPLKCLIFLQKFNELEIFVDLISLHCWFCPPPFLATWSNKNNFTAIFHSKVQEPCTCWLLCVSTPWDASNYQDNFLVQSYNDTYMHTKHNVIDFNNIDTHIDPHFSAFISMWLFTNDDQCDYQLLAFSSFMVNHTGIEWIGMVHLYCFLLFQFILPH
jgi:hypothetical protein